MGDFTTGILRVAFSVEELLAQSAKLLILNMVVYLSSQREPHETRGDGIGIPFRTFSKAEGLKIMHGGSLVPGEHPNDSWKVDPMEARSLGSGRNFTLVDLAREDHRE
jgi:hypothetical protein